jgi:hypothetical protein
MPIRLVVDNEPSGEILKDEGVNFAFNNADPAWKAAWFDVLFNEFPFGWEGLGEEIRFACLASGMAKPSKPQLWSSMIGKAMSKGLLVFKRPLVWLIPTDPSSHARPCRVLIRTDFF